VIKAGYGFVSKEITTGKSGDSQSVSGNRWGVDFVGDNSIAGLISNFSKEDFETADFSKFPWINSGDGNWDITFLELYAGTYSAEAGQISDNQRTTLKVSIECIAGDITFYRRISSERSCDYLRFSIDGVEMAKWSGTEDWDVATFPVEEGTRIFEWTYSKDGSISRGYDSAWIDEIVFPLTEEELREVDGNKEIEENLFDTDL
jgi:hypothetical protein